MARIFHKSLLALSSFIVSAIITLALIILASSSSSTTGVEAGRPASAWHGRRIYQIMTDRFAFGNNTKPACGADGQPQCTVADMNLYLGGNFRGIIDKLDYIQELGFNAIWISPSNKQLEGMYDNKYEAYHGYWQTDLTANKSNINPHFGTPQDLQDLIAAAHSRDIWVMTDMVLNHVRPGLTNDFSSITPLNESKYYHPDCQVNVYQCHNSITLRCRLANLADLNQDVPYVTEVLLNFVKHLMDLGFDGIRADTVMYINNNFWQQATDVSQTIIVGEVWSKWSCQESYIQNGVTSTLNYQLFDVLRNAFLQKGSMRQLGTQWRQVKALPRGYLMGNFVDNHDNTRWLSDSGATAQNFASANSHMIFQLGIPIVWQGTEHSYKGEISDNTNRWPIWTGGYSTTTPMAQFLKRANAAFGQFNLDNYSPAELWQDDQVYCFARGPVLHCVTNQASTQTREIPDLPFKSGDTVCDWLNPNAPCQSGNVKMNIQVGTMPSLFYAKSS